MTIRTIADLEAEIEAGKGQRGTTGQLLQDILDSVKGVGGVMLADAVDPVPVTGTWAKFVHMASSRNTRGISVDLLQGEFTIEPGCDGSYGIDASLIITSTVAGWVEIGISKNGQAPFTKMRRTFNADDEKTFIINDGLNFAETDTIGIAIRASGNAPTQMSVLDATFRAIRI